MTTQEQIEQRLEQSKRLLQGASDPTTTERIAKFIADLSMKKWKRPKNKADH